MQAVPVPPSTLLPAETTAQVCLCWTEDLHTTSKQIISLLPSLPCSGEVHVDVKALCPGRLALMSSYNTLRYRVSEGSFKAGENRECPKWVVWSHILTVLRTSQAAGLFLFWPPILLIVFIAMNVLIAWAVFGTLTSPFILQPLRNTILSTVDLGVSSFIYLIKHLSFVQQSRMQKAPPMPWHSCPTIYSSPFWAACPLLQPHQCSGGPPQGPPCQGTSQLRDCSYSSHLVLIYS